MLNLKNERELCYVVIVDEIREIPGKDFTECAIVNGWSVLVKKGQFKPGDPGIYFEIDSKVPETEPFEFLAPKHYKIKTQKYKTPEGQFWSQGLLMSAEDFGWLKGEKTELNSTSHIGIWDSDANFHASDDESRFLTAALGVTYAEASDNQRKAAAADKYKLMAQRHGSLFSHQPFRWLMKRNWGKKLLFIFFGKKKDKKTGFPTHFPYIKKTDQERVENMPWVLKDKTPFIVTEKCDGSSGTYILERKPFGRFEFYVCSRNVRQLNENQKSFYDENYYWECAKKYNIENKLKDYLKNHPDLKYVCWQGEVCGPGIQKNPHGLSETRLFCFHMIDSKVGMYDIRDAIKIWEKYNMEHVPIRYSNYILFDNFERFKETAEGYYLPVVCEGKTKQPREGFVYYKSTDPNFSFKNVSRSYLLRNN